MENYKNRIAQLFDKKRELEEKLRQAEQKIKDEYNKQAKIIAEKFSEFNGKVVEVSDGRKTIQGFFLGFMGNTQAGVSVYQLYSSDFYPLIAKQKLDGSMSKNTFSSYSVPLYSDKFTIKLLS